MAFRVEFLPRAKNDLDSLFLWILSTAPLHGPNWFNGLEQTILSLCEQPERCPVARTLSTQFDTVRQLLYGRYPHVYKIYYRVAGEAVEILHIRHGARKPLARNPIR